MWGSWAYYARLRLRRPGFTGLGIVKILLLCGDQKIVVQRRVLFGFVQIHIHAKTALFGRGSGLKKITDNTNALFNDGKNHVEFFSDRNYFKVTIHNALYGRKISDKSNVTDVTKTDMEEAIIEQIKLNPKVTVDQLAEKLQVNRRTILRCITLMKQKGTIKRIGSNRNGYWEI